MRLGFGVQRGFLGFDLGVSCCCWALAWLCRPSGDKDGTGPALAKRLRKKGCLRYACTRCAAERRRALHLRGDPDRSFRQRDLNLELFRGLRVRSVTEAEANARWLTSETLAALNRKP